MPADEELRSHVLYNCAYPRFVPPRIAADVRHIDLHARALEVQIQRKGSSHLGIVDIAVHGAKGLKSLQSIGYGNVADVTGVPDFVALFKVFENSFIEVGMGVGEETDAHERKGCKG